MSTTSDARDRSDPVPGASGVSAPPTNSPLSNSPSSMLEAVAYGFLAFDGEFRLTYVNENAARMMGTRPEALVGRRIWDVYPEIENSAFSTALKRAAAERVPIRLEGMSNMIGSWIEFRAHPTADGVGVTFHDISDRKRAEDGLRESEARLRQIVAAAPYPMMLIAEDGEVLQLSRAWCALTGYRSDELRTVEDWTRLAYGERKSSIDAMIRQQVAGGEPRAAGEATIRTSGGESRVWDFHNVPLGALPDGRRLMLATAVDVTERKRGEEASRFLAAAGALLASSLDYEHTLESVARLAVAQIADWCVVHIVEQSGAVRRMVSAHVDRAKDGLARELARRYPIDESRPFTALTVLRTGAPLLVPEVTPESWQPHVRDEGERALLAALDPRSEIAVPLVTRGHTLGVLNLMITESARRFGTADLALVEELARLAALAVQNARLFGAERAARAEAEAANRAKMDFLAVMSHELRTPLNAIAGYTELLAMGLRGPVTEQQVEDLARIQRNQRHLLTLINDVLSFAKLEAGHVELSPADVLMHDFLDGLESLVAPQVGAKGLRYRYAPCGPAVTARADPEKLRQIVLNLLSNAVKFTDRGGTISLACQREGSAIVVRVQDDGSGIPPDELERVFEPFVQLDHSLTRTHDGAGLGLAISRDLARAMGGDLRAESSIGQGSTFVLSLPPA